MIRSWKFWTLIGFIGGMVVLFAIGFTLDPFTVKSPLMHKPAPGFTVEGLESQQKLSLEGLKGKPVVLNFWGSWCAACMEEAHMLQAVHERFEKKQGVLRVVGIAMNDTPEAVKAFARKFGKTYFLALDNPQGDIALNYGVYGAPETFFIDANGVIVEKQIGAMTPESLEKKLAAILSAKDLAPEPEAAPTPSPEAE